MIKAGLACDDIDQIHARFHVAEHLASQKTYYHLAGGCRFDIQFAHGCAGIDDNDR